MRPCIKRTFGGGSASVVALDLPSSTGDLSLSFFLVVGLKTRLEYLGPIRFPQSVAADLLFFLTYDASVSPNPCVHKTEVHYQRGTLVQSRPCCQVVPFPSQNPSFPYTSPAKPAKTISFLPQAQTNTILLHHPTPETFLQFSLFPFSSFPQHIHLCEK